jgi:hypothetical protein
LIEPIVKKTPIVPVGVFLSFDPVKDTVGISADQEGVLQGRFEALIYFKLLQVRCPKRRAMLYLVAGNMLPEKRKVYGC